MTIVEVNGSRVLTLPAEGELLRSEAEALDLVAPFMHLESDLTVLPVSRLPEEFWNLSTGLAGAITQKLLQYGFRTAIVGDISAHLERSSALRAYVYESNRGRQLWFLPTMADVEARLAS